MNKKAFTMLELVFAIVVIGILSALAMPRMDRDVRQEAADHILAAIRFTQHMALMDNVILPTKPKWQRAYWSFGTQFTKDSEDLYYEIGADKNMGGNIDDSEAALDPANGKRLNASNIKTRKENIAEGSSPNIFLGKQYGVTAVNYTGGCAEGQYIAFDYLGRPHVGIRGLNTPNFSGYMTQTCTITVEFESADDLNITVLPETGYASVQNQPDL